MCRKNQTWLEVYRRAVKRVVEIRSCRVRKRWLLMVGQNCGHIETWHVRFARFNTRNNLRQGLKANGIEV
jgi:hypothetical protein